MKYVNKVTGAVINLSCELKSEIWEPIRKEKAPIISEKVDTKDRKKAVVKDGE